MTTKFSIPDISDADLAEMATRFHPLVLVKERVYTIRVDPNLRGVAFAWNAKTLRRLDHRKVVARFPTLHTYGFYGCFKPTIAEVLAQIPAEFRELPQAYFLVCGPETAEDLDANSAELDAGFHVAETTLFVETRP